jgi:hypothetical protein
MGLFGKTTAASYQPIIKNIPHQSLYRGILGDAMEQFCAWPLSIGVQEKKSPQTPMRC